jgi:hypothetical protein
MGMIAIGKLGQKENIPLNQEREYHSDIKPFGETVIEGKFIAS